jgi:2'-5' RNA ligase
MTKISDSPQWGSFALVSYIANPLGSSLQALRQLLPGEEKPQVHITVLPPRPLHLPLEEASAAAKQVLERFTRFEVELSSIQRFPDTSYLYLDIAAGSVRLHELHTALNHAELKHTERFAYRPHLTIGGPVSEENASEVIERAKTVWRASDCSPLFVVDEIVCLWLRPGGGPSEWNRSWSYWLGGEAGRGAAAGTTNQTS